MGKKRKVDVYWRVPDMNAYFCASFLVNPDDLEDYTVLDGPVSEAG